MHNACMAVNISIRDVPEATRDALAARAARRGQSLQEYLRGQLVELAEKPTVAEVLARVEARKQAGLKSGVTNEQILESLDEARRGP